MRFLAWHVDYFHSHVTEPGRAACAEAFDDPDTMAENALLVLVSVEQADEHHPGAVASDAAQEIADLAQRVAVGTVVLHPFAHLWGQMGDGTVAVEVLKKTADELQARGLAVIRTPFGWLTTLDIKAKGHPLSRMAREIIAPQSSTAADPQPAVPRRERFARQEEPC